MRKCLHLAVVALMVCCGGGSRTSTAPALNESAPTASSDAEVLEWVLDPARASMVYGSDTGIRVTLVPVSSTANSELRGRYLIRATGSSSDLDGYVAIGQRVESDRTVSFKTIFRGEPFTMLRADVGNEDVSFYGYGYTEKRSERLHPVAEAADGDALLQARGEQTDSTFRKIESRARRDWEQWQEEAMAGNVSDLPGPCGKAQLSIDWSTITDDMFTKFSVSGHCNLLINVLGRFCEQHPHAAERVANDLSFSCGYAGHPSENNNWRFEYDGKGHFSFVPGNESDAFQLMLNRLRNALGETRQVFRAGDRYFVMRFRQDGDNQTVLYNGDGTTFYPASMTFDSSPTHFSLPSGALQSGIERSLNDGDWKLICGDDFTRLETLTGAERDTVLEQAKYEEEPIWKREPYFLSRDNHGTYYFVDRYRHEYGGKRYRVFVGRRGQLKLTKLKGVVEDSEGTVFSTASGDLRLIVNSGTKTGIWIRGARETKLTSVLVRRSLKLIYDELGVYYGSELGFVCE